MTIKLFKLSFLLIFSFKRALKKLESAQVVMLNPESVILNHALNLFHGLVQNLFRAGLFQHLEKSRNYETLKRVQGDRKRVFQRPLQKHLTNYLIYVKCSMGYCDFHKGGRNEAF